MIKWTEKFNEAKRRMDLMLVSKAMNAGGGWQMAHTVWIAIDDGTVFDGKTVSSFKDYLELLEEGDLV